MDEWMIACMRNSGIISACMEKCGNGKRRDENFNELYAACHAAEDKLKELTLRECSANMVCSD